MAPADDNSGIATRATGSGVPIVAVGASAGGLDAASRLFERLPARSGMAFVLVQHLDPRHDSLLVELLTEHCAMKVVEAVDGCVIEADHLYVIPPGRYLAVVAGALKLTEPRLRDGLRMPIDFLIASLAAERLRDPDRNRCGWQQGARRIQGRRRHRVRAGSGRGRVSGDAAGGNRYRVC